MDRAILKRLRFALLSLMGNAKQSGVLTESDWRTIDRLAAAHRLQPHLHGRKMRGELSATIPDEILAGWRAAYRRQAIIALAQKRGLLDADRVLRGSGLSPILLKGAFLAWHAYPNAAERPKRDIDLLVEPDDVLRGFAVLEQAGWSSHVADAALLPEIAATQRHLPPLHNSDGVILELHGRPWDGGFVTAAENLRARSITASNNEPLQYPCAADMLAHLAIHAAHSHHFNVGPLVLADVDYLVTTSEIDWSRFWDEAQAAGFARAASAVLSLTDYWLRPGLLDEAQCPIPVPPALLDDLSELLVQEPAARKDIALQSDLRRNWQTGGMGQAIAAKIATDPRDEVTEAGAPKLKRMMQAATALTDPITRQSAAQSAHIRSWLDC